MQISKANIHDFDRVVKCLDDNLVADGFGFVNKMQVETEIKRGTVWVAKNNGEVIGVRVGKLTLWNIVVAKEHRGNGIGKKLMEVCMPDSIRVKNEPIGHLNKYQRDNFVNPTGFYEKMGYVFWGKDFGRNFWQRGNDKAYYHKKGTIAHISIFKRIKRLLFN